MKYYEIYVNLKEYKRQPQSIMVKSRAVWV